MNRFKKLLTQQNGFTLVELMVVVAIIGLLSAVAIPNFKKYQAKAKISEAKLQLSALYTAQSAFFSDYNMYAKCLRYMGFDPAPERLSRYFSVGFTNGVEAIDGGTLAAAVNSGLDITVATGCPGTANTVADTNTFDLNRVGFFQAGKGIGSIVTDTLAKAQANAAGAAGTCTSPTPTGGSCLGTQVGNVNPALSTLNFQAAAIGFISQDKLTDATAAGLTINNMKIISTVVNGF